MSQFHMLRMVWTVFGEGHTWCTIQISHTEYIGGAADSRTVGAGAKSDGRLTVHECTLAWDGGCQRGARTGQGNDEGREVHFDVFWR
jgi:hypothetical protein